MKKCEIYYFRFENCKNKEEKLSLVENTKFKQLDFERIFPDKNNVWINQTDNDFETLLPVCDKQVKLGKNQQAIFKLYTGAYKTNRDEWVIDLDKENLVKKIRHFIEKYNYQVDSNISDNDFLDYSIKWSRDLKNKLYSKQKIIFDENKVVEIIVRPFVKSNFYSEKILNDVLTENHYKISSPNLKKNNLILTINEGGRLNLCVLVTKIIPSYSFYVLDASQSIPLYIYDKDGNRHDNITDWALNEFKSHYQNEITKLDIFHYVYAVLHNPEYRTKYEFNLKREFPRIPYYENFAQWAEWGKQLMELHLNYETAESYPLERHDLENAKIPKAKLKADKESGMIILDDNTHLSGVPSQAWDYKLGNRSALEWILDQYKEKKPKDPTIAEKFNNYRFADYKEQVIDLLMKVCAVSVKTMRIINTIKKNQYSV